MPPAGVSALGAVFARSRNVQDFAGSVPLGAPGWYDQRATPDES